MQKFSLIFGICLLGLLCTHTIIHADELDDIGKELNSLKQSLDSSKKATAPLEADLMKAQQQIASIQQKIVTTQRTLLQKEQDLRASETILEGQKKLMDAQIGKHYETLKTAEALPSFFSSTASMSNLLRGSSYQRLTTDQNKQLILRIVRHILFTEEHKQQLEAEKKRLADYKKEIDSQSTFLAGEIGKAKNYQADLSKKIAALSERQKSILSARSGSAITSVGTVPIGSDFNASIGFKAQAPGNSFAVFSFGAYTHRKGMSQYGAKGRAQQGQSYKDISKAYYGNEPSSVDTGGTIKVSGHGDLDFETTYLYGIAEMPSDWPMEALKAQAVAARSFAYRYKKDGKEICTNEACQVFSKSKSDGVPGPWKQAVDETKGQVIEGVTTFYSSTTGGYINTSGWDTTDHSDSGDWTSRSYESLAGSPWFYKAWYRKAYQNSSDSCGRAHPWLSQEEFSDIVNAWIVRKSPNGADTNRIIPITIASCPVGGASGSPYSQQELRDAANNSGGAVTSVSSVSVSHNGNGQTTSVNLQTNKGNISIPGSEFKETFNLRAPGYISIPQTGFSFFNIEKT